jgi:sugar-specific transcriptional regulator TrmB
MNDLENSLSEMGDLFSNKRQASIYLSLLQEGSSGVEKIHKATGIHSEAIQRELKKMALKGTVRVARNGRNKKIQAVSISRLQEILEKSKEKFDFVLKPLLEIASENQQPKVNVFINNSAFGLMQTRLLKVQPQGHDVFVISTHPQAWREAMIEAGKLSLFERERVARKVGFLLSCFSAFRGEVEYNNREYFADQPQALKRKYRYIETADSSPLQIQVWDAHVVISIFSAEPSIHIVFEDKNIKKAMKSYFDILWKIGVP